MRGYEVYGEARPIVSLWRWITASLIFLVLGAGAWIGVPDNLWGLVFFVAISLLAATIYGLYLRNRRIPIGIKHDGERLLITGILDSGILVASKIEFISSTSLHIERMGERLASKKMVMFFASVEDARKVADWLTPNPGRHKSPPLPS